MGHYLEAVATVERDGRRVVLLHRQDDVAGLRECPLEQALRDTPTPRTVYDSETSDVHQPVIVTNQYVPEQLIVDFYNPALPSMELVLQHALRHRVGKQGLLEVEECRNV